MRSFSRASSVRLALFTPDTLASTLMASVFSNGHRPGDSVIARDAYPDLGACRLMAGPSASGSGVHLQVKATHVTAVADTQAWSFLNFIVADGRSAGGARPGHGSGELTVSILGVERNLSRAAREMVVTM